MGKSLVIVESPAKAKTINKFLGRNYVVKASMGHVRDLPKNPKRKGDPEWIGIDEEKDFEPHYIVLRDKKKTVDALVEAAKKADEILLAADPDREGEAICWHLQQILEKKAKKPVRRILFNEITKKAIREAVRHPREIDLHKVDAQQARRILDRIVGYRISPLLWEKVRRGISAGRVQTVALRMIVEREREIREFQPVEYWNVLARLATGEETTAPPKDDAPPAIEAKLHTWRGETVPWKKGSEPARGKASTGKDGREKVPTLPNEAAAREVVEHVRDREFVVEEVEAKRTRRAPPPPFTTSRLQQEAARRFRLPVARTMRIAQALYEGKELGDLGSVGLITYMRTDSVRIADEAIAAAREYIRGAFGERYLPAKARVYRQKKGVQDAHEAIRPTSLELPPEKVAPFLSADELKLYTLIWNRFVACQMAPAEFDTTRVDIRAGDAVFRVTGQVLRFPGWLQVYREAPEEDAENGGVAGKDGGAGTLPDLARGQRLRPLAIEPEQSFTQPPPRYTEAMLVRALEENGIGRPSTYASILSVLSDRDYVDKVDGRFRPSPLGELVVELLVRHFRDLFDIDYTARMEEELDRIELGEKRGSETLRAFNEAFRRQLAEAREKMENVKARQVPTDIRCDACGAMMVRRWGRYGEFLACERYPECRNTKDLGGDRKPLPDVEETCPKCGRPMVLKKGRWGPFLACSGYPECRTTRRIRVRDGQVEVRRDQVLEEKCPLCGKPLARKSGRFGEYIGCTGYPECRYTKKEEIGVPCPRCGKPIVVRRSRRGRVFYGCSGYPDCDFVSWKKPVAKACPKCGSPYLLESVTKRWGRRLLCPNEECDYVERLPDEPSEAGGAGPKEGSSSS